MQEQDCEESIEVYENNKEKGFWLGLPCLVLSPSVNCNNDSKAGENGRFNCWLHTMMGQASRDRHFLVLIYCVTPYTHIFQVYSIN